MQLTHKTLGRTGLSVSVVGLGTVEIGMEYGIGPKAVPDERTAVELIKRAVDAGITFIDTGFSYGLAEERIGISGIRKLPGVVIATKCAQELERGCDLRGNELRMLIRNQVDESLRRLRQDSLQLLQLHFATKEQIERGEVIDILRKIKEEGKAQHIGISTRGEEAPLAAIATGFFDTVQIAYSILDQRMAPRVLPEASRSGVGIINRSVFLKGSLIPARRELLPSALVLLKERSRLAEGIAADLGMDLPSLALRFALSNPNITTALIGTTKLERLTAAAAAMQAGPLPEDVVKRLHALAIDDPLLVDPSKWPPV